MPMSLTSQICIIFAAVRGYLDQITVSEMSDFEVFFYNAITSQPVLLSLINNLFIAYDEASLHYLATVAIANWSNFKLSA